tara:strand:+ start:582 stop:752 length:171 start_codon:yes stop_codon:yes gene_type:complete
MDLVAGLGRRVYSSEDLTSRRIKCGMDVRLTKKPGEQDGVTEVVMVGRVGLEPVTP